MKKTIKICVMFVSLMAVSVDANLLNDPGYESNALTTAANVLNNFVGFQGIWGVENATLTGIDGAITPAQGVRMLRMVDDGLSWTQGFQTIDVNAYAGLIDSGSAIANASALFNIDSHVPAALGGVTVLFFSTSNWGSQIGTPIVGNLFLDSLSTTWETAAVSGLIPVSTRWLMVQVAYQNSSLLGVDGQLYPGYVDATELTIVPEPATLGLLAFGGLALRRRLNK